MGNLQKLLSAGWNVEIRQLLMGEYYVVIQRKDGDPSERYSCIGKTLDGALARAEAGDVCRDRNHPAE